MQSRKPTKSSIYANRGLESLSTSRIDSNDDFVIPDLREPESWERILDVQFAEAYQMADIIMRIAGKKLTIQHVSGPTGARGRNSDNALIRAELGWEPSLRLEQALARTSRWIETQVRSARIVKYAA